MERFLLFDSDCGKCARIAKAIEPEAQGWLTVMSLRNPEMQALLDKVDPTWVWEPTLIQVDGEQTRAFRGYQIGIALLIGLGPFRAWRIAKALHNEGALGNIVRLLVN